MCGLQAQDFRRIDFAKMRARSLSINRKRFNLYSARAIKDGFKRHQYDRASHKSREIAGDTFRCRENLGVSR